MQPRGLAVMLPGQGSQFAQMATFLYDRDPDFTRVADDFFTHFGPEGGALRRGWLDGCPGPEIDVGVRAQPLLFMVDLAVTQVLRARGLDPVACVGHSVGELAAAVVAGVYDLPAGSRILAGRCEALEVAAPAGGLLAVAGTVEQAEAHLSVRHRSAGVVVGAVNAPRQTVLAGPEGPLREAAADLRRAGLVVHRVRAHEPFHSPVLAGSAEIFRQAVARERLVAPNLPIWSARTGRRVKPAEALRPEFWALQMAEPVLFWPALSGLLEAGDRVLVEAGPGPGLSLIARQHPAVRSGASAVVSLVPGRRKDPWSAWRAGLERVAELVGGVTWRSSAATGSEAAGPTPSPPLGSRPVLGSREEYAS